jgi:hypothetical protein
MINISRKKGKKKKRILNSFVDRKSKTIMIFVTFKNERINFIKMESTRTKKVFNNNNKKTNIDSHQKVFKNHYLKIVAIMPGFVL